MSQRFRPGPSRRKAKLRSLREELDRLLEENLHLRLERERALSTAREAARMAELGGSVAAANARDDVGQTLAYTAAMHEGLLTACRQLRAAVTDVAAQVSTSGPPPPSDRRVTGRRREDGAAPAHRSSRSGEQSAHRTGNERAR